MSTFGEPSLVRQQVAARPWRRTPAASAARRPPRSGTCGNCRRSTAARGSRSAESPRPPPRTPAAACTRAERRSRVPSMMSLVMRRRSSPLMRMRAVFQSCARCASAVPAERVLARTVLLQMLKPLDRLRDGRPMSGRHPPHHEIALVHRLEPFVAAAVEALVHGLPDVLLERLDVLPDRHVHGHHADRRRKAAYRSRCRSRPDSATRSRASARRCAFTDARLSTKSAMRGSSTS